MGGAIAVGSAPAPPCGTAAWDRVWGAAAGALGAPLRALDRITAPPATATARTAMGTAVIQAGRFDALSRRRKISAPAPIPPA